MEEAKMFVVYNKIIPFPGNKAMVVWPFLFVRSDCMTEKGYRHEEIHGRQQLEMLPIAYVLAGILWLCGCGWWSLLALPLYFWLYGLLWLVWLIITLDTKMAYRQNPFEREAYLFEGDPTYLERRRPFAWLTYLKM